MRAARVALMWRCAQTWTRRHPVVATNPNILAFTSGFLGFLGLASAPTSTQMQQLGNFIGAIEPWVELQSVGEGIYCVVDLHATTVAYDPGELRRYVFDTVALLLAAGLDPARCVLFR